MFPPLGIEPGPLITSDCHSCAFRKTLMDHSEDEGEGLKHKA